MARECFAGCVLILISAGVGWAAAGANGPTVSTQLQEMPRIDANEFTKLRFDFVKKSASNAFYSSDKERGLVLKAYEDAKDENFTKLATQWLNKCPIDGKVHLMLAEAMMKRGNYAEHFYHRYFYYGLMLSISSSGDGSTKEKAMKVVSITEEYNYLNHIGAKLIMQKAEFPYDRMKVTIKGRETEIYFDATVVFEAEKKEYNE